MSQAEQPTLSSDVQRGLDELRAKIPLLPEKQRSQFGELITGVEEQCKQLQKHCVAVRGAVEDLQLVHKYAQFDLEASYNEIREARRRNGLSQ